MIDIMKRPFSSHKGVAPIIATLLMVAIAVVGGVLIYVYTQGFFASTSTTTISTDVISMTGYDAKGGDMIYNGAATGATADNDAGKSDGECITIHVKNAGGGSASISNIRVDGVGAARSTTTVTTGNWTLYDPAPDAGVDATLAAGQEGTIAYCLKAPLTIAADATVSVDVTTKAGGAFTYRITEGQRK